MQTFLLFAIFDSKVGAFMPPWHAQSEGAARRSFGDLANESGHEMSKHAEDYSLFIVGEFNSETGEVKGCAPVSLGLAASYKQVSAPRLAKEA